MFPFTACPSAGDDGACASNESCSPGTDGYICSIVRNSCLDPENDLYGCEAGSTEINLSNCGIGDEDLEDLVECFDNVGRASVTAIWLGSNSFTSLAAGLFDGFDNIKSLSLGNLLTTLPLGLFDGLASLSYLYLGGNQFTSLPAGVFDGLESLLKIFLQDNPLTSLPAGLFNGLDALEVIYQPDNQLTSLPAGIFGDLKSLQGISLQNNQLASLPAGLFDGLDELQYLALYSNQLASLPAGLFDGLGALETLSLNVNQLTSLPAGIFEDLDALENLNLGVNQLASLPAGLFDGLHALQYLSLRWNDGLQCLPSLFGLGLVNGAELFLPDGFESGGECACPSLGDDGACDSDESCTPGTDGYVCSAVRNSCFDPDYDLYGCEPGSTLIDLDNCGIGDEDLGDLEECFNNVGRASVTTISMNYNSLTELPGGEDGIFAGFDSLNTLMLNQNNIETLYAESFEGLGGALTSLSIIQSRLTTIPVGCFDNLVGLQTMTLYGNDLAWLPVGAFRGLGELGTLSLAGNALSTLPAGLFDGMEGLTVLNLSENEDLQCVPSMEG
ncbi:Hypothetical leucine rich repeat protein [Ectocarpus siliculosus]|uniref:Hypothetical leucine rich repeat protein n=1 Tax=Ectocarpus siliculosus TaxID=2880 RepID=D7FSS1_ECTSI|nr:Hypothetical leucine rich repeat protein [Ectocarpus siliculosus]|eukprot:CBJ31212.1 Hypothetical leucine rich repeat protein [Ectocarpus siliculosus]